jgi:hypothetical protein
MKKIIYLLLFVFSASLSITACTEEEIEPQNEVRAGKPSDPK